MKKLHKIVMLTTDKSSLHLTNKLLITSVLETKTNKLYNNKPQHLYILSDDKIEESDYGYCNLTKNISKITDVRTQCGNNKGFPFKKIIVTTDKFLNCKCECNKSLSKKCICSNKIAQIPQQFIDYYITEYNKGNIITEVEVEYEQIEDVLFKVYEQEPIKLFINKDNTINISIPSNKMYSREEVEELIKKYEKDNLCYGRDGYYNNIDIVKNWIKTNL